MHSKLLFFLLIISSLMFSQRKGENLIDENISFKYEKTDSPDNRFGVIGSKGRQAFAAFVEIDDTDRIQKYFHYIKFKSFNFNSKPSVIYLCIYENSDGLPGKIVDHGKFLINIPPKNTFITADLSKLKLKVPEDGYFIGFEWILNKENELKGNIKTQNPPYTPSIAGFTAAKVNLYTRSETWRKEPDNILIAGLDLEITYHQDFSEQSN